MKYNNMFNYAAISADNFYLPAYVPSSDNRSRCLSKVSPSSLAKNGSKSSLFLSIYFTLKVNC